MHLPQKLNFSPLGNLIVLFAKVGAKSFGGAVPVYLFHQVLRQDMLTEKEYLEALNWSQSLPGPLATNLSAYLGWRFKGAWGALLSTIALVLPGACAILLASRFMSSVPQQQVLQGTLSSVAAAAVGLIVGMTWKLAYRSGERSSLARSRLLIAALAFILVGIFTIPVPLAIACIAPVIWYLDNRQGRDNESAV
jgi:chromate transporter